LESDSLPEIPQFRNHAIPQFLFFRPLDCCRFALVLVIALKRNDAYAGDI
jgi:hypothetical protein